MANNGWHSEDEQFEEGEADREAMQAFESAMDRILDRVGFWQAMRMLREQIRNEHHGEEMDEARLTALVHERVLRAVPPELWQELYTLMVNFLTQFLMEAHNRDTRDRH